MRDLETTECRGGRQPSVTAELPRAPLSLLHPHPPRSGSAFGLTQTLSGARMSVQR
jgi:hypothetical protein